MKDYFNKYRGGFKKRSYYEPFYNDDKDYNTNAPSYYDYLAKFNRLLKVMTDFINRLLNRNINVENTNSVRFIKDGDWIDNGACEFDDAGNDISYDDIITLRAHVILSNYVGSRSYNSIGNVYGSGSSTFQIPNAITERGDGLYAPDYTNILDAINSDLNAIRLKDEAQDNRMDNMTSRIDSLETDVSNIFNRLDDIDSELITVNNRLETIETTLSNHTTMLNNHESRISALEDIDYNDIINRITNLESDVSDLTDIINNLDIPDVPENLTQYMSALDTLISNLYNSGAISSNNPNFSFNTGRNIATGNINLFGGSTDGNAYIRTNSGSTENDLAGGV